MKRQIESVDGNKQISKLRKLDRPTNDINKTKKASGLQSNSEIWFKEESDISRSSFGRIRQGNRITENGILPPDTPEIFRQHPKYPSITVSTLSSFRRGQQIVGKGRWTRISVKEPGQDNNGKPRSVSKLILFAETFLGPRPSKHHFPRCIDNSVPLRLSNIIWDTSDQVLNVNSMTNEESLNWKPLVRPYSSYMYSKDGRIHHDGLIMRPHRCANGYLYVKVQRDDDKTKFETKTLHGLIALSEYGPRPEGCDIAHLDDNPLNCAPSNLIYQSKSENLEQAFRKYMRPVKAIDPYGSVLYFESVKQAALDLSVSEYTVYSKCRSGKPISFQGLKWVLSYNGDPTKTKRQRAQAPDRTDWVQSSSEFLRGYEFTPDGLVRKIGSVLLVTPTLVGAYVAVKLNNRHVPLHLAILDVFHGTKPSTEHKGDHLDENKTHNCRSNLEWTKENTIRSCGQPCARSKDGKNWEFFKAIRLAARQLAREQIQESGENICDQNERTRNKLDCGIRVALKNPAATAYGYKWRRISRGPDIIYDCADCGKSFSKRGSWIMTIS